MPRTQIKGTQVQDGTIQREDLDIVTENKSVTAKVVGGTNVSLESTGADVGTGDVTVNVDDVFVMQNGTKAFSADQSMGDFKLTNVGSPESANDAVNREYVDSIIGTDDKFDFDGEDLMPAAVESVYVFEYDDNNDLMFTVSGTIDTDFELDGNNDIMPMA